MDKIQILINLLSEISINNISKEDLTRNFKHFFIDDKFNEDTILIFDKYLKNEISEKGIIYFINKNLGLTLEESKKIVSYINLQPIIKYKYKKNDLVTIIITTYNRKNMLEKAIKSIQEQDYKNIEIIIIDDCSTDGSKEYVKSKFSNYKNIKYYTNETNKGPGFSRSKAFNEFSNGKYIVFMDDDDFFLDNTYISKAIYIHEQNENLSFVAAETFIEDNDKNKVCLHKLKNFGKIDKKEYFMEFQTNKYPKPTSTFTAVFNKSKLEEAGLKDIKMVNDSSIYLRALLTGDAFLLNNIVGVYRIHGNNITFACSSDFIIENLNEKFNIGLIAQSKFDYSKNLIEEWFFKQTHITLTYYFYNSPFNTNDFIKILKFIKSKSRKIYYRIRYELYSIYIKKFLQRIKKWLKMKLNYR